MITENQLLRAVWDNDPIEVVYTGTAGVNAEALAPGLYYLNAETAVFFKQGESDVVARATAPKSNYLAAGAVVEVNVPAGGTLAYVSVVRAGGTSGSAYLNYPSAG